MPRSGPRQIYKYSKEFKLAAVRLSHTPGMQVKAVATALGIHRLVNARMADGVRPEDVKVTRDQSSLCCARWANISFGVDPPDTASDAGRSPPSASPPRSSAPTTCASPPTRARVVPAAQRSATRN